MANGKEVILPGRLNLATLPGVVRQWPLDSRRITVDFSAQRFVYPTGTVGLAYLVESARRAGHVIEFKTTGCPIVGYWQRMGFFDLFDAPLAQAYGPKRPPDGRFAEICRADNAYEVDTITEQLVDVVRPTAEARPIYSHVVSEALNNVCQHSRSTGFSAGQYYERDGFVRFCIADWGCGLKESLSRHSPRDDTDAIRLALKVGISGPNPATVRLQPKALRNRGIGLSTIKRMAEENGGRLTLWSGTALYPHTLPLESNGQNVPWQGTLLAAKLPRQQFLRRSADILREVLAELGKGTPTRPLRFRRIP